MAPPKRSQPRRPKKKRNKATSPPSVHLLRPGLSVQQIRLLGEGGMGVVHLVRDPVLQRQAALKLVRGGSPIRLSRFRRETSVTARLDHPSIPPVFEAGTTVGDDEPYLLMRFVDGESLSEILERRNAEESGYHAEVETRRLLHALIKVAEAVSFAHSRRIVHRDLKPANIMIGAFGEVFVMDWGLARDLSESAEEDARARSELAGDRDEERPAVQGLTQEGTILGTPGYMAPEQARGEDVDAQADVFALGAILCEILTGKPPFTGPTPLAVLGLNRAGEVEYPRQRFRDVNLELDAISRKALAPECEDRYASTEEFVSDLRAFVDGRAVSVYAYNRAEKFLRFIRRHPSLVSAALATSLLAVGIPLVVMRARVTEVNELIEAAQVALNQSEGSQAARLFNNAIDLDPDNHVAHLGLREANDLQSEEQLERRREEATKLIKKGNRLLGEGDLEGARGQFIQAKAFSHPEAYRLLGQVEQAIDEDREQAEAKAMRARSKREAQRHRGLGIQLLERGDHEQAQAEFIKAIAFGSEEAKADLIRVEEDLVAKRAADLQRQRQRDSRRLTAEAERILDNKPSTGDLEEARKLLIQALGFYGNNERAQGGLLRIDRLTQRLDEARRQRRREHDAGKELGIARRKVRLAEGQVEDNYAPEEIRKTYLDAMAAYGRAQYLLPSHGGIGRERASVTRDFAELLVRWGQQDLAAYFLESSGIDPSASGSPVAPLQDEVIEVVEAQIAGIRIAFGGGTVRAQPTRAFDGLRDYLHSLGKRYQVQIQVRSSTSRDQPPRVLAKGLWIKVTDTQTGIVHPTIRVMFEGGPYNRPVMVTENGHRLITPWDRAHNLDEEFYTAMVDRLVREQLGAAQRGQ